MTRLMFLPGKVYRMVRLREVNQDFANIIRRDEGQPSRPQARGFLSFIDLYHHNTKDHPVHEEEKNPIDHETSGFPYCYK